MVVSGNLHDLLNEEKQSNIVLRMITRSEDSREIYSSRNNVACEMLLRAITQMSLLQKN